MADFLTNRLAPSPQPLTTDLNAVRCRNVRPWHISGSSDSEPERTFDGLRVLKVGE